MLIPLGRNFWLRHCSTLPIPQIVRPHWVCCIILCLCNVPTLSLALVWFSSIHGFAFDWNSCSFVFSIVLRPFDVLSIYKIRIWFFLESNFVFIIVFLDFQSYASILYLRVAPGFRIILRGKDVEHHNIVNDMMMTQEVTYRPMPGADGVPKDSNVMSLKANLIWILFQWSTFFSFIFIYACRW